MVSGLAAPIDVLVSGTGSNLRALHAQAAGRYRIRRVVADRPCTALEWAEQQSITTALVPWQDFGGDRRAFSLAVAERLCTPQLPALVACAGFMRLLSPEFFGRVACPILNIHPSLLPAFKGAHAQRQALAAGVQVSGATVHFMTAQMDAGGILAQAAVPVYPDDTEAQLQARILLEEHRLYAEVIGWVLAGVATPEAGGERVGWRADWRQFRQVEA